MGRPSYNKSRTARLKAAGLCMNCGLMPAVKDRTKCKQCTHRHRRIRVAMPRGARP